MPDALFREVPETAYRASSKPSIEEAVNDHFDALWRFLRRLGVAEDSVEDAVQEVFTVFARRISEVEPGLEKSFLFGTAVRVAKGIRRRRAVDLSRHAELEESTSIDDVTPEQRLHDRRALQWLDSLLDSLGEPNRSVFVLFELEGFTLTEIADLLSIPRGTVASRLRRSRADFLRRSAALRAKYQNLRGEHG